MTRPEQRRLAQRIGCAMIALSVMLFIMLSGFIEHQDLAETYTLAEETAAFLETTCEKYDNYALGTSAKAIQSVCDMARGLKSFVAEENLEDADFLKHFIRTEHLGGVLVLGEDLSVIAQADMDGQDAYTMWESVLQKPAVQQVVQHPEEVYSDHADLNNTPYDFVVLSRGEGKGLLLCYASAQKPDDDPYELSISSALTNNTFHKNPVVVITDGQNLLSTNSTEPEEIENARQSLQETEWCDHALTRIKPSGGEAWYGLRRVYGTYTVYVCYPDREVFANRTLFLASGFLVYLLICVVILVVHVYFDRLKLENTKNQLRILREMHEAEERSFRDALTGLYNRNYLEQKGQQFAQAGRMPISLIMADCNYLKQTNDTLGHEYGDRLLQRVARVLQQNVPEHCRVIRAGGDEFMILCQNCTAKRARQLVDELRKKLAEASDEVLTLSVAFGVHTTTTEPFSLQQAYELADQKMYAEKQKMHAERSAADQNVVQ